MPGDLAGTQGGVFQALVDGPPGQVSGALNSFWGAGCHQDGTGRVAELAGLLAAAGSWRQRAGSCSRQCSRRARRRRLQLQRLPPTRCTTLGMTSAWMLFWCTTLGMASAWMSLCACSDASYIS